MNEPSSSWIGRTMLMVAPGPMVIGRPETVCTTSPTLTIYSRWVFQWSSMSFRTARKAVCSPALSVSVASLYPNRSQARLMMSLALVVGAVRMTGMDSASGRGDSVGNQGGAHGDHLVEQRRHVGIAGQTVRAGGEGIQRGAHCRLGL